MLPQTRFFKACLGIICILVILLLLSKVSFLFKPVLLIFHILIVPFILSGFLYYLLRPLVAYLCANQMKKTFAILFIYFVLMAVLILFLTLVWPTLQFQVKNFIEGAPLLILAFQEQLTRFQQNRLFSAFLTNGTDFSKQLSDYLSHWITVASNYVTHVISFVTNFVIVVATVPIILYYMLKEGEQLPSYILRLVPRRYRKDGREVMSDIDSALSGFIVGRVIITLLLGVMMFIGFLLIGLPFSLLITVAATILNLIPYIGPILGAVPVLIVAFAYSPGMVLWSLVVVLIAQQVEGSLLAPHIYGKRLDIHPLTTIVILLVAGDIAGILGVILAIPLYMVVKILIARLYSLFLEEKVEELVE
ncbi:AI-2E family transporter [Paenibacillus filicis]|uniref:AI-2E family transporter n=1 Tax=Paenibacillus gyeongsangnamensis TaxID=3388067 RepID=A0ABT4Q7A0_9BACL|nr:AI-2E family transporter [Paenibacillus filicis]MCZ8512662.1 AI-2E family transporter [Paenibacillus filicis]